MTDEKVTHPCRDQLAAFVLGKLSPQATTGIQRHLEQCEPCCKALLNLQDDTFVELVRASRAIVDAYDESRATKDLPASSLGKEAMWGEARDELLNHPRYRVLGLLGKGGMGEVHKAQHKLMDRPVALKLINPKLVDNPQAVERFRREVQTAARLSHPNIVTAYDAEQVGDLHFLVMEFIEGTDLAEVVKQRRKLSLAEACDYMRQAADGLQHAFELGMVHRDIKPQNLMLTPAGRVTILDFGLARFTSEIGPVAALKTSDSVTDPNTEETKGFKAEATDVALGHPKPKFRSLRPGSRSLTDHGVVMGTPNYIAPEQLRHARKADIRADIYSLGCTLYYLLTGHAPYQEGSLAMKSVGQLEQALRSLTEERGDVPPELVRVVERMMAIEPARRYESPDEVARALAPLAGASSAGMRTPPSFARQLVVLVAAALLLTGVIAVTHQIVIQIKNRATKIEIEDGKVTIKTGPGTIQDRKVFDTAITRGVDVSSDGKTLCYLHPKGFVLVLREMDSDTEQLLPTEEGLRIHTVAVSPDSKQVAYSWINDVMSTQLRIIGRDGAASRLLNEFPRISAIEWSPDGKDIVAVFTKDGSSEIRLVPVGPGDVRILASIDFWIIPRLGGRKLCFSPDGNYIVYDPSSLLMVPGEPSALLDLRIHPDGHRVAFVLADRISGRISALENLLSPGEDMVTVRVEQ